MATKKTKTSPGKVVIGKAGKTLTKADCAGINLVDVVVAPGVDFNIPGLFAWQTDLVSMDLSAAAVKSIPRDTFRGCTALTSVKLPAGLEEIEAFAFRGCTALETVDIPESVKTIGNRAFADCDSLKVARVPASAAAGTDVSAFDHCEALVDAGAFVPSDEPRGATLTITRRDAYYVKSQVRNMGPIDEIVVEEGVTELPACAFRGLDIRRCILPRSLKTISAALFNECRNLEYVELPGVEWISKFAFCDCESLRFIDLPDTLRGICECAFYKCRNLRFVRIPDGCNFFVEGGSMGFSFPYKPAKGSEFGGCRTLEEVEVPASLANISPNSFAGCPRLKLVKRDECKAPADAVSSSAKYCVIDISAGPKAESYPVEYLDEMPEGGWDATYRSDKIVFARIKAGAFAMGGGSHGKTNPKHEVTLTNDYYMAVHLLTLGQMKKVLGKNFRGCEVLEDDGVFDLDINTTSDSHVVRLRYGEMRGETVSNMGKYTEWPKSSKVASKSFLGLLRTRTGIADMDLPTDAEWEMACRGGSAGDEIVDADGNARPVDFFRGEAGESVYNAFGVGDIIGREQMCLDYARKASLGKEPQTNPVGDKPYVDRFKRGPWVVRGREGISQRDRARCGHVRLCFNA